MESREFLYYWLLFVGSLRVLAVVLGYLDKKHFQRQVFRAAPYEVSALAARLFSAWCSITAALCVMTALNLDGMTARSPACIPLFLVTFFSFAVALAFFILEVLVYRTVDVRGVWMQVVIASLSLLLMYRHMASEGLSYFAMFTPGLRP